MRLPNIPLEVNKHFWFNSLIFLHWYGFDIKHSIEVLTLIVVAVESIVILLGIELYKSGFVEFSILSWENLNAFEYEELFE